jgi:acetyl esterase
MSHPSRRSRLIRRQMPLRTRMFTRVAERVAERRLAGLTLENVERLRALTFPARAPYTWITGRAAKNVDVWDTEFVTRDGVARAVRVYRPHDAGPHPVVVFFHGGGFVLGNLPANDPFCTVVAEEVSAVLLSVDYRMSPEHRAPQAALDAVDAVRWAPSYASVCDGDPDRLAVCGDSAGGNLATVATHVIRDEGGPAIAHQALIYPGTDLSMSFPSIKHQAAGPFLTERMLKAFAGHYLGPDDGIGANHPLVSPYWRDDLSGLPPALVQTADLDPLRDEGLAYAGRLTEAGVPVRATNYLGAAHAFVSYPGASIAAAQAMLELVVELRRHLVPHARFALD